MINFLGQLVEFIDRNHMILGLVQTFKNDRLGVLTVRNRQIVLSQRRIVFTSPSIISSDQPREILIRYLRHEEARREELSKEIDVVELWELVLEEKELMQLSDLAELVFTQPITPEQISALLRALFNERLHFHMVGNSFEPLTIEQLEQKIKQRERELVSQAEVDDAVIYLKLLPLSGSCPPPPANLAKLLSDLVVFEDKAPNAKKAKEIVAQANLGGKRQIFDLLVRLGVYIPHQNLDLLREGLVLDFIPEVLAQANELDPAQAFSSDRKDLTGLYTFTIDSALTTDFDDALSFIPNEVGGGELWVHITDAAALLPFGGVLEQEALLRGSSIYLPDVRIPMFPPILSENFFSLREGLPRVAISCLILLDAEGRVLNWQLMRSILTVNRRLTYDEADNKIFTVDSYLSRLYSLTQAFKRQRHLAGAYFLPLPEINIEVDQDSQIWIKRINSESPSRDMVAETAILANWLKARFLVEQGVPAFFRTQAPCREILIEGDRDDLFLHFKQRKFLNRLELSIKPGLHAMLGLTPYVHATSPIRRFLDLILQRQLTAVLSGQLPPYNVEDLQRLLIRVEPKIRQGIKIRQARQRYWLLVWLQTHQKEPLSAIVMEQQSRRWQLLLTDFLQLIFIPSEGNLDLKPGEKIMVKIIKVDPFYDLLKVAPI